jgi:putative endopeptidase
MCHLLLRITRRIEFVILALAIAASLSIPMFAGGQNDVQSFAAAEANSGSESGHGLDPSNMDKTCKPCEDFFHYADGGWTAKNPVPADHPSWGTFNVLQEKNRAVLRQILEEAAQDRNPPPGSNMQKIGSFYVSCMDEQKIEADGIKPLEAELARITQIQTVPDLETEIAHLQAMGVNSLFRFGSAQDRKDSTQVIGFAGQGGLGMPDRDYYIKTDDKSVKLREQYLQHVGKIFQLMGDDAAQSAAEAKTVMGIETTLAQASMTRVEMRDPDATYHKMDAAQLKTLTPDFSWPAYFQEIGAPSVPSVNVGQPKFFETVNQQLTAVPLSDWKTYLRWHLVSAAAPGLSAKFVDEDFNFNDKILRGTEQNLPRWERCVASTDRELGEALGQIYVDRVFPPAAKARAQQMVQNLIAALRDDLATLPWMSPETRVAALAKLNAFTPKIGYPDKWRNYSGYQVERGSYALNVLRGRQFEFQRTLNKIGKPVDRKEFGMTPPTVNAYYNSSMNEIVFPAGILQPPFYDPDADDAVNYGGIGAVIGHEMTHGFDDQGRKFDAQGNRKDWWAPEDLPKYQERATCVEKQFDVYVVEGDLHENGKLVLGESIADLGGLTIAFKAFEKSLEGKPRPQNIDGLTPEQRFFISWATTWATNDRPEFERLQVKTNPHPLDKFRAIAAPSNLEEFRKAFGCKAGDAMVRSDRCQIW